MGGYPWIVIHRYLVTEGLVMGVHPRTFQDSLGILGVHGYLVTEGLVMGVHPWTFQDSLGILGVHGYSVTGVGHGCTSSDSLG